MELLIISKGVEHLVLYDEGDREFVLSNNWFIRKSGRTFYVLRNLKCEDGKWRSKSMHSDFIGDGEFQEIDHHNGNSLDNRRENLRPCTRSQNQWNRRVNKNSTSKLKGITFDSKSGMWRAYISYKGKRQELGFFHTKIEAGYAYDAMAKNLFGEFAKVNFLKEYQITEIEEDEYEED
jgi:hypothetical protein